MHNFSLDCSAITSDTTVFSVNVGDTGSISMSNCGTPTYPVNPIWVEDLETFTANSTLHFNAQSEAVTSTYWIDGKMIELRVLGTRPLPVGAVQSIQRLTIGPSYSTIPKFNLTTDDNGEGQTLISNNSECAFDVGPHPFASEQFTVTRSGRYTFEQSRPSAMETEA